MTRALLTALFTASFVLSPLVTTPFSGFTADQLPVPQIDPPVQPAGWAFSIWGLIYGWLVMSAGFGLLRRAKDADWDHARLPLILTLAAGTPYLWLATRSAGGSTVLITVMLMAAIWALFATPAKDRWWLQTPVALLAGWLTAATYVSMAQIAAGYGVLMDSYGWAFVGIAGALLLGAAVQELLRRAPEYSAPIIWALIGIIAKSGTGLIWITLACLAGIVVLGAVAWRAHRAHPVPTIR